MKRFFLLIFLYFHLFLLRISSNTFLSTNRDQIAVKLLQQKLSAASIPSLQTGSSLSFSYWKNVFPFSFQSIENVHFESIPLGRTNFCFKCSVTSSPSSSPAKPLKHTLFIKLALNRTREYISHVPILLPPTRLRYEYEGMKSFAKYTPQLVPRIYHYDPENHILFLQYLTSFQPLKELFLSGNIPNDVGKIIGTLMGRNHAKTFHLMIPSDQRLKYERLFANQEHIELWKNNFFSPTLQSIESYLSSPKTKRLLVKRKKDAEGRDGGGVGEGGGENRSYEEKLEAMKQTSKDVFQDYLLQYQPSENDATAATNKIYKIILQLQQKYLQQKETLIHGDLECNNILYSFTPPDENDDAPFITSPAPPAAQPTESSPSSRPRGKGDQPQRTVISEDYAEDTIQLKIIDFEKCSYGLCGVDLGIFLMNYIWYYVAHSQSSIRKSLMNQFFTIIDCYRAAFQVQINGAMKQQMMKKRFSQEAPIAEASIPATASASASASATASASASASAVDRFTNINVEDILYDIIVDTIGYAGLYLLFASITYPTEFEHILNFSNDLMELQFGNRENRKLFIEQRRIHFLIELLLLYDRYSNEQRNTVERRVQGRGVEIDSLLQDVMKIFQQDDLRLATDHFTEFWY